MKGISKEIVKYDINCALSIIEAAPKLPRGRASETPELQKGSAFHIHWLLFKTESCRIFKTALLITECVTRRKWEFPTRSRSAPLKQMQYPVEHLRFLSYIAYVLRCADDGSL
jgi:hypothetical protein